MLKWLLSIGFLLLQACGGGQDFAELDTWMQNNGKLKVLSTTAMIDDLVAHIGGEDIDHLCLIVGEIDPHSYELVKGDDEKFERADLVFHNGLFLEHGASIRHRLEKHPYAVALGDQIQNLHPEKILRRKSQVDPHIWMDVQLWAHAIDFIEEKLVQKMPERAEKLHIRAQALRAEFSQVHHQIQAKLQGVPAKKRYLVTSHDAFDYFTRAYLRDEGEEAWRCRFAAPEGLAPEGQISSADIQSVIDYLVIHQVHTLFPESNVSKNALKKIADACAALGFQVHIVTTPLHGDAMGARRDEDGGYLAMMLHNADVLVSAWREESDQ